MSHYRHPPPLFSAHTTRLTLRVVLVVRLVWIIAVGNNSEKTQDKHSHYVSGVLFKEFAIYYNLAPYY